MAATVHGGLADFERHQDAPETLAGLGFAIRMNNLKASASSMAPDIVARALGVCGISGYRNDSPYAVGRHLRDAHGAALMISNDRVLSANAAMLLVHKEVRQGEGDMMLGAGRQRWGSRIQGRAASPWSSHRDRRAWRLRARRGVRRHAEPRRSSHPGGWGRRRCRSRAVPADPEPQPLRTQRISRVVPAPRRHDSQFQRQRTGARRAAAGRGSWRRLGRGLPARPGRAHTRSLLSGISDADRLAAGGRPAGGRDVVLLPPRTIGGRRPDADVPDARARAGGRRRAP